MKGAQQVLSSFWELDDRASHEVMNGFYSHLSKGKGSNNALREGQVDYILSAKNSNQAAPYYWAGHQLYGRSQRFLNQIKQENEKRSYSSPLMILVAGLCLYILFKIRRAKS
jgi:hypothetical protein